MHSRSSRAELATRSWLREYRVDVAITLVLAAVTLWRLLPGVAETPFHRDEARWIHRVSYLQQWRHPLGDRWQEENYPVLYRTIDERRRLRAQPPLASYAFGLGLLLQGRDLTANGYWIMSKSTDWNQAHGNFPAEADLRAARRTNVGLAVVTVVALFILGRRLTNRVGAVVGSLAFAIHPLTRDVATRAWADTLLVLLLAFAAFAAYRLADHPTWEKGMALGVLLGLGGATKLSPLALSLCLGGFGLGLMAVRRLRPPADLSIRSDRLARSLLAAPVIALTVFVASYPYLWPNPVSHTYRMFAFRAESFDLQAASFPAASVTSRTDAARRVGDELGRRFSVANELASWLDDAIGTHLTEYAGIAGIDLALAIVGAELLLASIVSRGPRDAATLVTLVLLGEAALIVVTMGVEFARYLFPVLLAEVVCVGVLAGTVWCTIQRLAARSSEPHLGSVATSGFAWEQETGQEM